MAWMIERLSNMILSIQQVILACSYDNGKLPKEKSETHWCLEVWLDTFIAIYWPQHVTRLAWIQWGLSRYHEVTLEKVWNKEE